MRLSIRYKILLGFAIILILSYVMQALAYSITEQYIKLQTDNFQLEKAKNAATQIQNFLSDIEINHLGIARQFNQAQGDYDEVTRIINYIFQQNYFLQKISIVSTTGRELLVVDRNGVITPPDQLSFEIPTTPFEQAVKGQKGFSKIYFDEKDALPTINIYTPIVSDQGVQGVIKGRITLDRLWDLIGQVKLGTSGFAYVVDEEGRLIAHPDHDLVLEGPNYRDRGIITALLSNSKDVANFPNTYINEKNIPVISNAVKIPTLNWIVVVEQPITEAYAQRDILRNLFFTTFFGSLALLIIIAIILAENFAKPIRMLRRSTELLQAGKLLSGVNIKSGDEIEDLAHAFNAMATRLHQSMTELQDKVAQLENQKKRLDVSAKLLLKSDLDVREFNEALEQEKENISAERNKLAVILSGIRDGVIAVDLQRNIILFNTAAEQITGLKSENVLGKSLTNIIKLYDGDVELVDEIYSPIRRDDFEGVVFTRKNLRLNTSEKQDISINLVSGKIKEGVSSNLGCILTIHDITGERRLEEMRLDFVSMAAHELRTPLTAIRGYARTIEDEIAPTLSDEHKEYIRRLGISAQNLSNLIDNLLNVSRIERGSFKVEILPIDVCDLVNSTVTTFKEIARVKNQEVTYTEPKEKIPYVLGDKFRIGQVLANLLANAVNYTRPSGKISITVESKFYPEKNPSQYVAIHVTDTGQGIPKEALPQLFTKFFRVSGALEQGSKGTGLGLFISKSIIEMHKGEIWVESEYGKGSTFTFTLPVASEEEIKKMQLPNGRLSDTGRHGIILNSERYRSRLDKQTTKK